MTTASTSSTSSTGTSSENGRDRSSKNVSGQQQKQQHNQRQQGKQGFESRVETAGFRMTCSVQCSNGATAGDRVQGIDRASSGSGGGSRPLGPDAVGSRVGIVAEAYTAVSDVHCSGADSDGVHGKSDGSGSGDRFVLCHGDELPHSWDRGEIDGATECGADARGSSGYNIDRCFSRCDDAAESIRSAVKVGAAAPPAERGEAHAGRGRCLKLGPWVVNAVDTVVCTTLSSSSRHTPTQEQRHRQHHSEARKPISARSIGSEETREMDSDEIRPHTACVQSFLRGVCRHYLWSTRSGSCGSGSINKTERRLRTRGDDSGSCSSICTGSSGTQERISNLCSKTHPCTENSTPAHVRSDTSRRRPRAQRQPNRQQPRHQRFDAVSQEQEAETPMSNDGAPTKIQRQLYPPSLTRKSQERQRTRAESDSHVVIENESTVNTPIASYTNDGL